MAKIVTLKSPNAEDIYPVTDASGIRVTGNVTLQQALDGFVYADDPTTPANPDGWITPSDIDWDTFTYSTSEQRVGTWIDGKPIYKKTVDFGSLPNNTSKSVAHGITGISRVIKIEAIMYQGANSWIIPYTAVGAVSVEGNNVIINTRADLTGFRSFVTVYYTKTTD